MNFFLSFIQRLLSSCFAILSNIICSRFHSHNKWMPINYINWKRNVPFGASHAPSFLLLHFKLIVLLLLIVLCKYIAAFVPWTCRNPSAMVDVLIGTYHLLSVRWQCRRDFGQLGKHRRRCCLYLWFVAWILLFVVSRLICFGPLFFGSQILICEFLICFFSSCLLIKYMSVTKKKQVPLSTARYAMVLFSPNRSLSGSPKNNMTHLFAFSISLSIATIQNKTKHTRMVCVNMW